MSCRTLLWELPTIIWLLTGAMMSCVPGPHATGLSALPESQLISATQHMPSTCLEHATVAWHVRLMLLLWNHLYYILGIHLCFKRTYIYGRQKDLWSLDIFVLVYTKTNKISCVVNKLFMKTINSTGVLSTTFRSFNNTNITIHLRIYVHCWFTKASYKMKVIKTNWSYIICDALGHFNIKYWDIYLIWSQWALG